MYEQVKQAFDALTTISAQDWEMIEPMLRVKKFKKNQYYLSVGEIENQIGFTNKGSFRWYFIDKNGEEVNYHFFLDNNFVVGFDSFISQAPSQMFIQAMEDSEVVLLPKREVVLDYYAKSHSWEHFGRIICESVYIETTLRLQDFLFRSAEERYLALLKKHPDIFQKVSLSNISSYLGIQGPSLSRIRKRVSKL
jgi:CRP-like cAMP-binding protein